MSGRGQLPTVDPHELAEQRRRQSAEAGARRLERERELARRAAAWLGDDLVEGPLELQGQLEVVCELGRARALLSHLRDELGFEMLTDVTGIDYLKWARPTPERFAVLWNLTSLRHNARLLVRAYVSEDDPIAPTVSDLWPAANFAEREVYDMYGIEFSGHPNLIRLLMPLSYTGFPLRKDYPLRGRGERDDFPVIRRTNEEEA